MFLSNKNIVIFGGSGAIGSAAAGTTMLGRLPTLQDVAQTAVFLMSDRARAMTAAYVNLTSGMIAD
ncbi:hypothetical protein [Ciceribacter sp. RN22]|uniref:hypothetical protein n=1 Tax=Ciceribacter sp. RN22 TaxID=2954932 RepID=UPI0020936E0F|nr:hypothetical protein [Ciceribacter sp. RN22]MCO6178980.1 hypothetical protein [Ciceribacter sp. RN22]